MNLCIERGRLTADPEQRDFADGNMVAMFSLAVSESYRDRNGNKKEVTHFLPIRSYGKQAEVAVNYLTKGDELIVSGKVCQDSWEDKTTGKKRSALYIRASHFDFIKIKSLMKDEPTKGKGREQDSEDADIPF